MNVSITPHSKSSSVSTLRRDARIQPTRLSRKRSCSKNTTRTGLHGLENSNQEPGLPLQSLDIGSHVKSTETRGRLKCKSKQRRKPKA